MKPFLTFTIAYMGHDGVIDGVRFGGLMKHTGVTIRYGKRECCIGSFDFFVILILGAKLGLPTQSQNWS